MYLFIEGTQSITVRLLVLTHFYFISHEKGLGRSKVPCQSPLPHNGYTCIKMIIYTVSTRYAPRSAPRTLAQIVTMCAKDFVIIRVLLPQLPGHCSIMAIVPPGMDTIFSYHSGQLCYHLLQFHNNVQHFNILLSCKIPRWSSIYYLQSSLLHYKIFSLSLLCYLQYVQLVGDILL